MNMIENNVLLNIIRNGFTNQRKIATDCEISLGVVNKSLQNLFKEGYIDSDKNISDKTKRMMADNKPRNAIILAAGIGMSILSTGTECTKAMLEVDNETVIERTIRFLHNVGINEIYVVVGFAKEQFEYLIDDYGVKLVVNKYYATKNNLHSINLVVDKISNTYIIPCDIWCRKNPFSEIELLSWYSLQDKEDSISTFKLNRKNEVVNLPSGKIGNRIIGIAYINNKDSIKLRNRISYLAGDQKYNNLFWDFSLFYGDKMFIYGKKLSDDYVVEINSLEQLEKISSNYNKLTENEKKFISVSLDVNEEEIKNIKVIKKGLTNISYLFECNDEKYIIRVPRAGTDRIINRLNEKNVYEIISGYNISDELIYMDENTGYRIMKYIENTRHCDVNSDEDLIKCMTKLREFHNLNLKVNYDYDVFVEIEKYEKLRGLKSVYRDYETTKENVYSLKKYIDSNVEKKIICHMDANNYNFLITDEEVKLIDWEYAGMQDPDIDIAMFGIYALYNKEQMDRLIDIYYEGKCSIEKRIKIYCYCAVSGLLWSNWCEYKRNNGVEFGEYSIKQYRYAKEFYRYAIKEIELNGL